MLILTPRVGICGMPMCSDVHDLKVYPHYSGNSSPHSCHSKCNISIKNHPFDWCYCCGGKFTTTITPAPSQNMGGSNTSLSPKLIISTFHREHQYDPSKLAQMCYEQQSSGMYGLEQSPTYYCQYIGGSIWIDCTQIKVSLNNPSCGDNSGDCYANCGIPPYSVFANGNCNNCDCKDVSSNSKAMEMVKNYGCPALKAFSTLCSKNVTVPSICAYTTWGHYYRTNKCCKSKKSSHDPCPLSHQTTYGAFEPTGSSNYKECYPIPPEPSPPPYCRCSIPDIPSPVNAYPLCTEFLPSSLYAGGSSDNSDSYTNNNCAPPFIPPGSSEPIHKSTFAKPYARVTSINAQSVSNWPPGTGEYFYCGQGSHPTPSSSFVPQCNSHNSCGGQENCVYFSGSNAPKIAPGYVASSSNGTPASPEYTSFPVVYLYGNTRQSSPSINNIAFSGNAVGNTQSTLYGIDVNQFAEIGFDFSAINNTTNCSLLNIQVCEDGQSCSGCAGSESITVLDSQGNKRTFRTFLPKQCQPNSNIQPTLCDQFCVAEIFNTFSSISVGCFLRPQSTTISTSACSNVNPNNTNCNSYDIPSNYNSNSKWCFEYTIEGQTGQVCGSNTFSSTDNPNYPVILGYNVSPLLTDYNYNTPGIIQTQGPNNTKQTNFSLCTTGTDNKYGVSSCPAGLYYYATGSAQNIKTHADGASVLCPNGIPEPTACPSSCNCSSCTGPNSSACNDPLCQIGCNCVNANDTYCSETNQYVSSSSDCPGGSSNMVASQRPSDRIQPAAPTTSSGTDLGIYATLSPWNFYQGTGRGRTPLERGLCLPLTPWDPVDCCTMFGPKSNFTQAVQNGGVNLYQNINNEDFYNACQAFTCGYCTMDKTALAAASGGNPTDNDVFYIREACNQIYQKCSTAGTNVSLIDPTVFSDPKLKSYFESQNNNIQKITNIYGVNTICSFFQPGNADSSQGAVARCTVNDKVQDGNSKSWAYCGCFAPGSYQEKNASWTAPANNFCYCQDTETLKNASNPSNNQGYQPSINIPTGGFCGQSYNNCSATSCP